MSNSLIIHDAISQPVHSLVRWMRLETQWNTIWKLDVFQEIWNTCGKCFLIYICINLIFEYWPPTFNVNALNVRTPCRSKNIEASNLCFYTGLTFVRSLLRKTFLISLSLLFWIYQLWQSKALRKALRKVSASIKRSRSGIYQ